MVDSISQSICEAPTRVLSRLSRTTVLMTMITVETLRNKTDLTCDPVAHFRVS